MKLVVNGADVEVSDGISDGVVILEAKQRCQLFLAKLHLDTP